MRACSLPTQNETRVLEFTDYGKRFIVKHKMSPDAFVQIAMMIAYYRMCVGPLSFPSLPLLLCRAGDLYYGLLNLFLLFPHFPCSTSPWLRYGTFVNVYESVQTKFYLHGRTEAMRSVTPEVLRFGQVRGARPAALPRTCCAARTCAAVGYVFEIFASLLTCKMCVCACARARARVCVCVGFATGGCGRADLLRQYVNAERKGGGVARSGRTPRRAAP